MRVSEDAQMGYWMAAHPTLRLVSLPPFEGWFDTSKLTLTLTLALTFTLTFTRTRFDTFKHVAPDSPRKLLLASMWEGPP